jgi:Ca2+-binding RTX toxin-like protein
LCGQDLCSQSRQFDRSNYQLSDSSCGGGDGNDLLLGIAQADVMRGGGGSDIFMVAVNSGNDTIADFQKRIDLIGLSKGISFCQLSFNSDRVLFEGQTLATLTGIQTSTLTANDFINL